MSQRTFVIVVLLLGAAAPCGYAAGFSNFGGLSPLEVVVSESKPEMRVSEDADLKKISDWDFLSGGKMDPAKAATLYTFIQEKRARTMPTMLNPFFAAKWSDGSPIIAKDKMAEYVDGQPRSLLIGQGVPRATIDGVLTAANVEEVAGGTGKSYKNKATGETVSFKDVTITWYFQQRASSPAKYRRADWDTAAFTTSDTRDDNKLYETRTVTVADYTIESPVSCDPYSPPGEVAFDVGVNDGENQQPANTAQGVTGDPLASTASGPVDFTMEVYVELKGKYVLNGAEKTFESLNAPLGCVAQCRLYVEDHVPPLPDLANSLNVTAVDQNIKALQPGDTTGNSFMPGNARYYQNDGSGVALSGAINPEKSPTPLYYWPNSDPVDRDNDGVHDFTWANLAMKNNNANDLSTKNTFNYETGMSMYNRVKIPAGTDAATGQTIWHYMYYVPYRPVNGEMFGPYAGRCMSSTNMDGRDPYDPGRSASVKEAVDPFYKPFVPAERFDFRGKTFQPKALLDTIYGYSDAGVEVQANIDSLKAYGFEHIAGISVKWNRECVQGITLGTTADPELKIAPGTMLIPTGFSAAKIADTGAGVQRVGNFNAEYDVNPAAAKSLLGTPKEGTDVGDSFFKINAADCCNNDVVIASGTYGSEDNLKPNPKVVIEEMDTQQASGKLYYDVATVPNDNSGAGEPLGSYDADKVLTRIHQGVPLYPDPPEKPGVQGVDFRGYGSYSNNASVWNGMETAQTLQNPIDQKSAPFLGTRAMVTAGEPPFEEDRRYKITISADDNLAPHVKLPDGTDPGSITFPVRKLTYKFYYHPSDNPDDQTVVTGIPINSPRYDELASTVDSMMVSAGFNQVLAGAVIDVPNGDAANGDLTLWQKEPVETFDYTFKSAGRWVVRVDAVDRSNNARVMLVPLNVGRVGVKTRGIDLDSKRTD